MPTIRTAPGHVTRYARACVMLAPVVLLAGTGQSLVAGERAEPGAPAAEAQAAPRVFFVSPQDGAQVSSASELELVFGVENYEISPVPQDFDPETDTARADVGHYHLGVNTGCYTIGEVIPPGVQGWVHFGDGSNTMTMQVEPGTMELSVQIGDDAHRTRDGLCQTIRITVTGE